MRDINKELEKFYALLDALESDDNPKQASGATPADESPLQARPDREPVAGSATPQAGDRVATPATPAGGGNAPSNAGPGVYSGRSARLPNRTIESPQQRATGTPSEPAQPARPPQVTHREIEPQSSQLQSHSAQSQSPRPQARQASVPASSAAPTPDARTAQARPSGPPPSQQNRPSAPAPSTSNHRAGSTRADEQASRSVPSMKESIRSIPQQGSAKPISKLPPDLMPTSKASPSAREMSQIPNGRMLQKGTTQTPQAPARPASTPVSAKPAVDSRQQRGAVARPASRPAATTDNPTHEIAARARATEIRPVANPATPPPAVPSDASALSKGTSEESWSRKVKLPDVSSAPQQVRQSRTDLDSLVSDVKEGLTKKSSSAPALSSESTAAAPVSNSSSSYIPSTKFSETTSERSARTGVDRVIAPELLELPADETPPRTRFTLAAAAVALVVPTVLAGILVFNMSGDPDSVEMVASTTLENGKAVLSMSTTPEGARVYLNNELVGVTPFSGVKVDPGDYVVTTEKEGYIQADTVMRLTGSERLAFNLSRLDSDINTLPAGGHILSGLPSDEQPDAEGDSGLQSTDEGDLSASADGNVRRSDDQTRPPLFEDAAGESNAATTSSREAETRDSKPERSRPQTGGLVLTSDPAGATVWIDREAVGETPLTLKDLRVGSYDVEFTKSGYNTFATELRVAPSIATPFNGKLEPMAGTVAVTLSSEADVYIDGQKTGNRISGLGRFEVPAGQHTLRFVSPEFGEAERSVTVEAGKEAELTVSFEDAAAQQLVAEAGKLFASGEYESARELYAKALSVQPNNALASAKIKEIDRLQASVHDQELTDAIIENGVYLVVDTPPQLIGGLEELHKKVVFPEAAYRAGVSGRVYVQFVVDENGNPSDYSVTRGLPLGCNDAAIEAISKSKFVPGKFRGRNVKARHTLFLNFSK
ncbi:MAG: TonB family protein [Rhodothermales bacterium]